MQDQSAADRRDNGFTQTLTQDEIDALPDDPDEMADELARMAGPGAQIFVDGFRGGRLPPKDQIQQIRFHTNSFSAEYHEAGMVRVEVITKPGMGGWRGNTNFGFRDESLNATNAFADEKGPEQMRRYMVNFQGPIAKGKTGLSLIVRRQQLLRLAHHRRPLAVGPGQRAGGGADRCDELQRARRAPARRQQPARAWNTRGGRTSAAISASATSTCRSARMRPTTAPTRSGSAPRT